MLEEAQTDTIPQMVDDVRAGKLSRRKLIRSLSLIGISTAGISAIAAAASQVIGVMHSSVKSTQQNSDHNMQLHDQHLAHQQQNNTHALQQDYAERVYYFIR